MVSFRVAQHYDQKLWSCDTMVPGKLYVIPIEDTEHRLWDVPHRFDATMILKTIPGGSVFMFLGKVTQSYVTTGSRYNNATDNWIEVLLEGAMGWMIVRSTNPDCYMDVSTIGGCSFLEFTGADEEPRNADNQDIWP